jgi:lipopolysaccharide/colanic/teichoic acid biosynthesis glycosyltransferase
MAFALLLRKLRAFRSRTAPASYFVDENSFRHEVSRERLRADRNQSQLAVLLIELPTKYTARDLAFLGRFLHARLRLTDTAGRLSDDRIAVLLPETETPGAWKVADDIRAAYENRRGRLKIHLYVYPESDRDRILPETAPAEQTIGERVVASATGSFETLFCCRTPWWKRPLDVVGAVVGLVLSAPLVGLAAIAIKTTSRGPVFYCQEREGLVGRHFRIVKLRTMCVDAEGRMADLRNLNEQDGPAFKMRSDPRTTWVGAWLRRMSLDELPQFWNVLRGDMSLVGPRPLPTEESRQCDRWRRQRLQVKPGMTGVWQVFGRNAVAFDEWMRMDLRYIRQSTLWYDLRLLALTLTALRAPLFNAQQDPGNAVPGDTVSETA